MARKKTTIDGSSNIVFTEKGSDDLSQLLGQAFDRLVKEQFGHTIAPSPIVTPTGIVHLDYLLGGGLVSSKPIMMSSTPESGKSTFCFQFSNRFINTHPNGVVVYLDIEGAGNPTEGTDSFKMSRIDSFGLNNTRFQYQPVILDINGVFDLFEKLSEIKQAFEEKTSKDFNVLIIWDSLSATRSSKTDASTDVNQIIGYKARELTWKLEKYSPLIAFKRFSFIIVDQVRANLKLDIYAPKERSVGTFSDYRAATNINSLNHMTGQWLYFSKKKNIDVSDGYGNIDGWEISVKTEKNKYAPSQCEIMCIFDKNTGISPFWSHFKFISDLTPTENKMFKKNANKLNYPLCIRQAGAYYWLQIQDPDNLKTVLYKSEKFYKRDLEKIYNDNNEFKQWFDYAVSISAETRILNGMFKSINVNADNEDDAPNDSVDEFIPDFEDSDDSGPDLI